MAEQIPEPLKMVAPEAPVSNSPPVSPSASAPSPVVQNTEPLTHEECMKKIAASFKEKGMEKGDIEIQMGAIEKTAKQFQSTDPFDVISKHMEKSRFKDQPENIIEKFLAVKLDLVPSALSEDVKVNPSSPLQKLDEAGKNVGIDRDEKKGLLEGKAIAEAQKQAAQNQQAAHGQREMVPLTLGGVLAMGLNEIVGKAASAFEKGPGKSFNNLLHGSEGLGMNNPNMNPTLLADQSMTRLSGASEKLALLTLGSSAEDIAKAKSDVLDAAGDAQRYMGNENRSHIAQMSEGKKTEFQASDEVKDRSKNFQDALKKAGESEVGKPDEEFQKGIKSNSEKAMEMVKQLLESLKEMASKLFGADNENKNDNKPATTKPAGPR